jgi:hypothetical protein
VLAPGVEDARRIQTSSTKLLAELLKAEDAELFATENAQSLTQEFFVIASTYLSMVVSLHPLFCRSG